jgi:hypothetical protein
VFRCVPSPESTPRRFYLTPKLDYSLEKRHRNSQKNLMASHSIISCSYLIGNLMVHPYLLFGIVTNNNNIIKLFCWLSLKWNAMTGMFYSTLSFQKCTLKIQKNNLHYEPDFSIIFFSFFFKSSSITLHGYISHTFLWHVLYCCKPFQPTRYRIRNGLENTFNWYLH